MLRKLSISCKIRKVATSFYQQSANDSENSENTEKLKQEAEHNKKVQEAMEALFVEINDFQNTVFEQSEMDYLLRSMHVKDALAVACYFKLGFMTNAKNETLALNLVEKIKNFQLVRL